MNFYLAAISTLEELSIYLFKNLRFKTWIGLYGYMYVYIRPETLDN